MWYHCIQYNSKEHSFLRQWYLGTFAFSSFNPSRTKQHIDIIFKRVITASPEIASFDKWHIIEMREENKSLSWGVTQVICFFHRQELLQYMQYFSYKHNYKCSHIYIIICIDISVYPEECQTEHMICKHLCQTLTKQL